MAYSGEKLEAVSVALDELAELWKKREAANEAFELACEAVAMKSAIEKKNIRLFIKDRITGKVDARAKSCEQYTLLFDNLGA